jgi:hypothetical protein
MRNPPRSRSTVLGLLFLLAATCSAVRTVRADALVLVDGRTLMGELLEENRKTITFRCVINEIWTTMVFERREVDHIVRVEGDQSDLGAAGDDESGGASGGAASDDDVADEPRATDQTVIPVIPLRGQVGGLVNGNVRGTFDAAFVRRCFEQAEEAGAELVILEIDSPGGTVVEMEAICETIIEFHDRLRIAAFVREAYSAAAIIALTCRELAVHPDAQLGAAVIIRDGGDGPTPVEAKFASPHYAKQRGYMKASGHPYEIVAAMTIQEIELWWSTLGGFRTEPPPVDTRYIWEKLDSETTVLTLTAEEAVRLGIAGEAVQDPRALALRLGFDARYDIDRRDAELDKHNRDVGLELSRLTTQVASYFRSLSAIVTHMNAYVQAAERGDAEAMHQHKAEVNRNRSNALRAATRITRIDPAVLARRAEVPDAVIDRLEKDRELLAEISALMRADSVEGYNKAADRVNEVLEAWRELLSGA